MNINSKENILKRINESVELCQLLNTYLSNVAKPGESKLYEYLQNILAYGCHAKMLEAEMTD